MHWTIGDYLREHGYRSAVVGKTHSRPDVDNMERLGIAAESEVGQRLAHAGFEPFERDDGLHPDGLIELRGEPRYNDYLRGQGYETENPWDRNANGSEEDDGQFRSGWFMRNNSQPANIAAEHSETPYMTSRAMECIEEMGDTPWCIHLSYIKPHWPYHAPAPYHNMYGPEQMLPQKAHPDELVDPHPVYEAFTQIRGSQHFARQEVRERVIPAYMGLIKQIDDEVGRTAETRFVELVDLAATFLDIAGGEPQPHKLEGHSLLPLLHGVPQPAWREYTISEVGYSGRAARQILDIPSEQCRGYMIRDERWKYMLWEGYPPQLFDLENDPDEFKDLGRDPAYEDVRRRWHDELFTWLRHRAINSANSPEYVDIWGPAEEDKTGVLIGYWSEEEYT